MARGWESKSVEEQQSQATALSHGRKAPQSQVDMELERKREGLALSRKQVLHQLQSCRVPQRRSMLQQALNDLDSRLEELK